MNHLGVLVHGETQVLVLHGFLVEVDLWDGRDHFAKLQLLLPLLLLSSVVCFSSLLRLVSVAGYWLCSSACCWLCSSRFFSSLPQIFHVLLAVLAPLLLHFILLATGSLAVVPSVLLLLNHFVVVYRLLGSFLASSNTTAQH